MKNIIKVIIIGLVVNNIGWANTYNDKKLWNSAKTGAVGGINYFKDVNANIKNEDWANTTNDCC